MSDRFENRAKNGGYNYAPEGLFSSFLNRYEIGEKVSLQVCIQREIYRRDDTGWSIYLVDMGERRFKINGIFVSGLMLDHYYMVEGKITEYNNERQLSINSYQEVEPEDEEAIVSILKSIEELNASAYKVYKLYGPTIIHDIKNAPELVAKTLKTPIDKVLLWKQFLTRTEEQEQVFHALKEYGLKDSDAKKLLDSYGVIALDKIENNPYFLIDEVEAIGFVNCDKYALQHDYPYDGIERVKYGILHILKEAAYEKGHCYLPDYLFVETLHRLLDMKLSYREVSTLCKSTTTEDVTFTKIGVYGRAKRTELLAALDRWNESDKREPFAFYFLHVPNEVIEKSISCLLQENRLIQKTGKDGEHLFLLSYYARAEEIIANFVLNMKTSEYDQFPENEQTLEQVCRENKVVLENKQREAALRFTRAKGGLFILNGAAGCGKTFVLKIILDVLRETYKKRQQSFVAKILAPTGKAAQVAHQATGLEGYTIHRALGMVKGDGLDWSGDMIEADVLIIDEFSMVDVLLGAELFEHIGFATKVIILGDTSQLPSIGPGSVLKDLIQSKVLPTVTLDVVKRQEGDSGILENANRILAGQPLQSIIHHRSGDAYIVRKESALHIRDMIQKVFRDWVGRIGLQNVQVLCPQRKTQLGTEILNYILQQTLYPDKDGEPKIPVCSLKLGSSAAEEKTVTLCFKCGDKVIHIKNNYSMAWYYYSKTLGFTINQKKTGIINGEMGQIVKIEDKKEYTYTGSQRNVKRIYVKYDSGYVIYENDFSELAHAYAITIHKAQGSQWPVVIAPIAMTNRIMLNRYLLYTLYTRAQNLNFLIGQRDAISYAVQNSKDEHRFTTLKSLLCAES